MKSIKIILMGCLLFVQAMSFCGEGQDPIEVTLVCYDKGYRKDMQPLVVDGVMQMIPSGRLNRIENGRIEHVSVADLKNTFSLFEEVLLRTLECDSSVLQRVLFDYGIGGVTEPNPAASAVYGEAYDRLVAFLRPKIRPESRRKVNKQDPLTTVRSDERQVLPDTVMLKCTDGIIENVSVSLLVHNFEYFEAYFRNWGVGRFAYTAKEVVVDGTVQDMKYLLALISSGSIPMPEKEVSLLSCVQLANSLLPKKSMDQLIRGLEQQLRDKLYSKSAYEKFLK